MLCVLTNLVAHVLFRRLVRETSGVDLFARMRRRGEVALDRKEVIEQVGAARDGLLELERAGSVRVGSFLRRERPEVIVDRVITAWDGYHSKTIVRQGRGGAEGGGRVVIEDPPL